jgi:hypothetical protein
VQGDGNQGGFKLWHTNGVTITDNWIQNKCGPGGWPDTDNANTTISDNTFAANTGPAIIGGTSTISQSPIIISITDSYIVDNNWVEGLNNYTSLEPVIYVSGSDSDRTFGGVPAYPHQSVISGNTLVDNGGGVFLWQDPNRDWTGPTSGGDKCSLVGERTSRHRTDPFGHDARSTFNLRKDTGARA